MKFSGRKTDEQITETLDPEEAAREIARIQAGKRKREEEERNA